MDMIVLIHSTLRWLVLIVAVYAIARAFMGMSSKSYYTIADDKAGLMLTIVCDLQLLLGLVLYFVGGKGFKLFQGGDMGFVMKNAFTRFFAVEHILMMIIAIAIIHIGRARTKKGISDQSKHKSAFIFYLIGLLIILASIPWPFRAGFEYTGWL